MLSAEDFRGQEAAYRLLTGDPSALPHALLITGQAGFGKRSLAMLIAMGLLCEAESGAKPCGVCGSCIRCQDGNHPDLIRVRPGEPLDPGEEKGKKSIPVKDIRIVAQTVGQHAFEGARKAVIIEQAETMTAQAQNALLKTLEEPPAGVTFCLTSVSAGLLLPTTVSRCRELPLHAWSDAEIRRALKEKGCAPDRAAAAARASGGSMGRAISIAADDEWWNRRGQVLRDFFGLKRRSDIPGISSALKENRGAAGEMLDILSQLIHDATLVCVGQRPADSIGDYPEAWQKAAASGQYAAFVRLQDTVSLTRRMLQSNVGIQALWEKLLLKFMEERSRWS